MRMKTTRLARLLAMLIAIAVLCPVALAEEHLEPQVGEYMPSLGAMEDAAPDDTEASAPETDAQAETEIPAETESSSVNADDLTIDNEASGLMDYHQVTLGKGEKLPLYSASGAKPTFTTSNKKIAKVSTDGTVTAVKVGKAVITATLGDVTDTCAVTVMKAPGKITLEYSKIVLGYDATRKLGDSVPLPYKLPAKTASFRINTTGFNSKVIRVDANGIITAVGKGDTSVKITTFNNRKATLKVTVNNMPKKLKFDRSQYSLMKGTSAALALNYDSPTLKYVSSNTDVATVDGNGKVTAVNPGVATVKAVAFNGASAKCTVEVLAAPTKIAIVPSTLTLGKGETMPLVVNSDIGVITSGLTWTTSSKKYVSVTSDGVVKGVRTRSSNTTITVKTDNGLKATLKVKVRKAPTDLILKATALEMAIGESYTLDVALPENTAGSYSFSSSDESVVYVDSKGVISAVAPGLAVVSVTAFNGVTSTCGVIVSGKPAKIELPETLVVGFGRTVENVIKVYDTDEREYYGSIDVSFAPEGIASFEDGKVRGLKEGTTEMTVIAGELTASCAVLVEKSSAADGPMSIGHRGGFAETGQKENTMAAFKKTASTGADGVEFDVRLTRDNVAVVHHDDIFTVKGNSYSIQSMDFVDLRRINPNIPKLDEVLNYLKDTDLTIFLEMKETKTDGTRCGKLCVEMVKAFGLQDRTVFFGFYVDQLKDAFRADTSVKLGYSMNAEKNPASSTWTNAMTKYHCKIAVCHKDTVNQSVVDTLHKMGFEVCVWTPNTRAEVQYFCDIGVDYILSNYPGYCVACR